MNPQLIVLSNLSSQQFYIVILNGTEQFWNTISLAFENFNAAHWAQYAISMQEIGQTGLYTAAYPPQIATLEVVTVEAIYQQRDAQPTLPLDSPPVYSGSTQGVNVVSINGSVRGAVLQEKAVDTQIAGTATTGTQTTGQMQTNVTGGTPHTLIGRTILWTSGTLRNSAAGIIDYDGAGLFTFDTMPVAPSVGDTFVIV